MGVFSRVVLPLLVAAVAGLVLYAKKNPETNTFGMLLKGLDNNRANREAMAQFARDLYTEAGQDMLRGKTVLVTGITSGLGQGIASHLYEAAPSSTTLVLPVRNARKHTSESTSETLKEFGAEQRQQYAPNSPLPKPADSHPKLVVVQQDLSDLDSIAASVAELKAQGIVVDVLVNNAGMVDQSGKLTKQGFDLTMGVNHFGTAALTLALRDQGLLAENGGRVVMVTSEEHRFPTTPLDDPSRPTFGSAVPISLSTAMTRYSESKLALSSLSFELADRWENQPIVYDICPGPVGSSIAADVPIIGKAVHALMKALLPSRFEAALPVLRLALDPAYAAREGPGVHIHHHMAEPYAASPFVQDKVRTKFIFESTVEILKTGTAPAA